jgi:hypothetical protein
VTGKVEREVEGHDPGNGAEGETPEEAGPPLCVAAQVEGEDLPVDPFCLFRGSPYRYLGPGQFGSGKLPRLASFHDHDIDQFCSPLVDRVCEVVEDLCPGMGWEPSGLLKTCNGFCHCRFEIIIRCLADRAVQFTRVREPYRNCLLCLLLLSSEEERVDLCHRCAPFVPDPVWAAGST